jgi:hypothetical protein
MIGITRPDGSTVRVGFVHLQHKNVKGEPQLPIAYLHQDRKKNKGPIRAITYCTLEAGTKDAPSIISEGLSLCAMADGFSKETGRVRSLTEALYRALNAKVITKNEFDGILTSYTNRPRVATKQETK